MYQPRIISANPTVKSVLDYAALSFDRIHEMTEELIDANKSSLPRLA